MNTAFMAYLFSAGAVVLAEMGDKTQLLAMAFATKYKASKVLIGVFIATVLNHALAVAAGSVIGRFESVQVLIQAIAALSFIFFGLWTIRGDKLEGEENRKTRFGPVITVAVAFFIAEMGDKTQFATVSIASQFPSNPLWILMGTTTGMLIADGVGIIIGVVMCRRIPERTVKLVSAGVFILFGLIGSYQVAAGELKLGTSITAAIMAGLIILTAIPAYYLVKKGSGEEEQNSSVAAHCKIRLKGHETDNT